MTLSCSGRCKHSKNIKVKMFDFDIFSANGRRPLKQASVPLIPLATCRRPDWLGSEFTLTDNMMCAGYEHGGVDTCQVITRQSKIIVFPSLKADDYSGRRYLENRQSNCNTLINISNLQLHQYHAITSSDSLC